MRTKQTQMREKVRETLASYSGVSSEEICLTRNTTESMNIIIQGLKIGDNDEILRTNLEISKYHTGTRHEREEIRNKDKSS